MYLSLANSPESEIFYVTESGNIHLVRDLSGLRQQITYTFFVAALDGRLVNPKNATVSVSVTVIPLQGPPVFNSAETEIPISQALNVTFYTLTAFDQDIRVCRFRFFHSSPTFSALLFTF